MMHKEWNWASVFKNLVPKFRFRNLCLCWNCLTINIFSCICTTTRGCVCFWSKICRNSYHKFASWYNSLIGRYIILKVVCSGNKRDNNKRMKHLATRGPGNCTTSKRMIYKPSWSKKIYWKVKMQMYCTVQAGLLGTNITRK